MEVLDDYSEFRELKGDWNIILNKSWDNDVFSTWEWLSCWWKHFGGERKLRILIIKDKYEIIGIAPFMLTKYNLFQLGKIRKIEFIGSPQSDYNNFVLVKKEVCLKIFFDYLMNECSDWDSLQLSDISEKSLSANHLSKMYDKKNQSILNCINVTLCPYIDLPNSTAFFMKRLSLNMRKNLRNRNRRLNRDFRVNVKTNNDFDTIEEAMNIFFKLHQKRWRSKGDPGTFAHDKMRNFHLDLAELFNKKGWLSLYFLTANEKPIATVYSFNYGQKKYGYLTGFDPEYMQYSPGNLLKMYVIEDCIQREFKEYDLMRGFESYKTDWTLDIRKNLEYGMVQNGWFSKVYYWASRNKVTTSLIKKLGVSLSF